MKKSEYIRNKLHINNRTHRIPDYRNIKCEHVDSVTGFQTGLNHGHEKTEFLKTNKEINVSVEVE
jgi:hypothetical protein